MCDSSTFSLPKYRHGYFCTTVLHFSTKMPKTLCFHMFLRFFLFEAMLRHKRAKKKTSFLLRLASETRFRDVLWKTKKPRECDRGLRFHVFNKKTKTIQLTKTAISTERGLKKWPLRSHQKIDPKRGRPIKNERISWDIRKQINNKKPKIYQT